MRRALCFVACMSLLIAACGSSSKSSSGGATSVPSPTSTSTPGVTSSGPSPSSGAPGLPGAKRIEPTHNAVDVHPLRFDPSKAIASADGVVVRFYGGIAPCFVLDHYTVAETAATVTITLYAGADRAAKPGTVCAQIALQYEVDVPLRAPLGARRVVDGAAA